MRIHHNAATHIVSSRVLYVPCQRTQEQDQRYENPEFQVMHHVSILSPCPVPVHDEVSGPMPLPSPASC